MLGDGDNIDGDRVEAHALEQVLGIGINVQLAALGVLGEVQGGDLGHVLILAFTLFFLQLEGDTADRSSLNTLHQMGGVTGDLEAEYVSLCCHSGRGASSDLTHLVPKTLGGDDGDFIAYPLVRLEVEGELGVVSLNDDFGGLLNGLFAG